MVELRKRPAPKEPPAPAPAAKRGRASNSTTKGNKGQSIVGKAKAAATKVKAAVTKGPEADTDDSNKETSDSKALQPTVEDESGVEKGETGMIPETTATAPSTVTAPGEGSDATETKDAAPTAIATADDGANGLVATDNLENPPDAGEIETGLASSGEAAAVPLSTASVGKSIPTLDSFGGSLKTHNGDSTTFATLHSSCKAGVIIFTYPKASTPGCTQQACMFRDAFPEFQAKAGYSIYGLSADSPKANSNFVTKQNLQYELLCDEAASLTGAIGMKKPGNSKGTVRGVVVVDKDGVVRVWFQGGPAKTVDAVKEFLASKN